MSSEDWSSEETTVLFCKAFIGERAITEASISPRHNVYTSNDSWIPPSSACLPNSVRISLRRFLKRSPCSSNCRIFFGGFEFEQSIPFFYYSVFFITMRDFHVIRVRPLASDMLTTKYIRWQSHMPVVAWNWGSRSLMIERLRFWLVMT